MRRRSDGRARSWRGLGMLAVAGAVLTACPADRPPEEEAEDVAPRPVVPSAYEATLVGVPGQPVRGTARFELLEDELVVTVEITGLDPDTPVPLHVHQNASCDNPGGILLNLDDRLTFVGEGRPMGPDYARTDANGTLRFRASRSLQDLLPALDRYAGVTLEGFDLGERILNIHGPDMPTLGCGRIERVD